MSADRASEKREQAYQRGLYPRPSTPGRGRNMAAIRRADTKPEVALRSALHAAGYRYRKDFRLALPGGVRPRPDIVFTRRKVAVFVDGCFWHACPLHFSPPRQNTDYWGPKITRNVERDRRYDEALRADGWTVVRVWEHQPVQAALEEVESAVGPR
ncbi:very short patch repair endonuclease [Modestobacter sp. KNN46-3]|uniref:very short patch repair endonuclease n=1 Tax=Modestobacter sp. KNN46-3 TaxID=2711218 RepID=UPI0013DE8C73|nr:very short patch repair endonuclease [Modestobacter sp. KNN46-3]